MTSKKSAISILIAVFIIGFAIGMATEHLVDSKKGRRHGSKRRTGFVEHFTEELSLTPPQVEQFRAILDTVRARRSLLDEQEKIQHDIIREYWKTEKKNIG